MSTIYKCNKCGGMIESSTPDIKDQACVLTIGCTGKINPYVMPPPLTLLTRLTEVKGWMLIELSPSPTPRGGVLWTIIMRKEHPAKNERDSCFVSEDLETVCIEAFDRCSEN